MMMIICVITTIALSLKVSLLKKVNERRNVADLFVTTSVTWKDYASYCLSKTEHGFSRFKIDG